MMWAFAIKSKITAAALLCAVFGLVLLTNYGERSNATKITNAIATIYEDRLVVEGYIFQYSQLLQQIEEGAGAAAPDWTRVNSNVDKIANLNALYAATKLTPDEKQSFDRFSTLSSRLAVNAAGKDQPQLLGNVKEAEGILNTLSAIQIAEAKVQMDSVGEISSFSTLISHFELIVLIVIAVIIQILVFSSSAMKSVKMPGNVSLN